MTMRALVVVLSVIAIGAIVYAFNLRQQLDAQRMASVPQTDNPPSVLASAQTDPDIIHDPSLIPAGNYVVDPNHSALYGSIRHAGLSHFVFRFGRFDARFAFDPKTLESPHLEVVVDPSSIDTNVPGFDTNMATSERHFNSSSYPEIRFVSDRLRRTGPDTGVLEGEMTFLGVTKPFDMNVTFLGASQGRRGATIGLSATGTLRRDDFGFATGSDNLAEVAEIQVEADFQQQVD
jgi:polyisoprenoid-binding protein YceI